MRRALALLFGVLLLAPRAQADAAADAAAAERVRAALGGLDSLRAEFRQVVTDAGGRRLEEAEGTMALQRPGRFRWDYRVPKQLIVSDGRSVWLHDVELEQVTVRPAADVLAGTPARVLVGQGDLASEFTINDGGRDGGLAWCRLVPREQGGDFRELRLGFEGRELRRLTLFDRLGQTTEIELSQVERNPRLDAGLFRFTPPPGVDVVGRAPGGPAG